MRIVVRLDGEEVGDEDPRAVAAHRDGARGRPVEPDAGDEGEVRAQDHELLRALTAHVQPVTVAVGRYAVGSAAEAERGVGLAARAVGLGEA